MAKQRHTATPRLMVTIGVGLVLAEMFFDVTVIPPPNQMLVGGLLIFLGVFWILRASGMFNRRP